MVEDGSDHSMSESEILVPAIDETQAISVVSSTYDISSVSGVKYLTESERQLGKACEVSQNLDFFFFEIKV